MYDLEHPKLNHIDGDIYEPSESKGQKDSREEKKEEAEYIDEHPWLYAFEVAKLVINYLMIALPWTVWGASFIGLNLVINAFFNEGWAEGNIWLICNSVFAIN